jgi:flagellar motor protein MotB
MDDDDVLDLNFWPSFADMMLALVLILVLILFVVTVVLKAGTEPLGQIKNNQREVVRAIAAFYGGREKEIERDRFAIYITSQDQPDLLIRNESRLQTITFSDHVLFRPDDTKLNPQGVEVLRNVGKTLKDQLSLIKEIQIQGHADPDLTKRFPSNTHLAALRAIEVFGFLQEVVGIDPAAHLMSATSFGEFKPVARSGADIQYDKDKLGLDNATPESKARNRRIELLLFYRL